MDNTKRRRRYSTGPQVLERYGGRSAMWLWRKLRFDPNFPRPVVIGGRRYFDEDELDAYDEASRMEAPYAVAS
jgi:predicted DNA-binding transcriptional regulator AlpA